MDLLAQGAFGYPTYSWFLPIVYGSLGAIPALLTLFFDLDKTADSLKAAKEDLPDVYDFIIGTCEKLLEQSVKLL
jgi:hypothetical protein